jgi:hypothetical protein
MLSRRPIKQSVVTRMTSAVTEHQPWGVAIGDARLTAVYIGTAAAEGFCAAAHRAQRTKEDTGGFRLDSRLFVAAEALRKVEPVKAV